MADDIGLIIDSFAGGGGASTGIEWALGRSPDVAINHDPKALAMHAANHPKTVHLTENIWKVDPHAVTKGKPCFLLWASPDCRHHSKAKGGAPVSASVRGLADVVILWAKVAKPQIILLENVEEFQQWGPVLPNGKPCPARRGLEFARWVRALEAEGYAVEWAESRACHKGAPTIRKRLYLCARRDGKPIIIPPKTHEKPDHPDVKAGKLKPWRTAAEIIDWHLPCPSIFLTKEDAKAQGLKVIRPLADKTMSRVARGFKRYVLDRAEPFIVALAHGDSGGRRAFGIAEPHRTVSTSGTEHAIVVPYLSHAQQGGRSRSAENPLHTICASTKDQNQVVAAYLAQHNGGERAPIGRDADAPAATITTEGSQIQPVMAYLASLQNNTARGALDEPAGTVLASGQHHAIVMPFTSTYYGTDQAPEIDEPLATVTTKDRFAHVEAQGIEPPLADWQMTRARQVAAFLRTEGVWDGGEIVTVGPYIVWDIGMRMLTPRELARAQGFPDSYDLTARGTLTETDQRHKIGNSVSPYEAASWVWWNCVHALTLPDVKGRKKAPVRQAQSAPAARNNSLFDELAA